MNDQYINLWCCVLKQAIKDFHKPKKKLEYHKVKMWIENPNGVDDIGTFEWICDLIQIDSNVIRLKIKNYQF